MNPSVAVAANSYYKSTGPSRRQEEDARGDEEESGWTAYLQDFSNADRQEDSFCNSSFYGSSMVSDAATGAAWKTTIGHHHQQHASLLAACSSIGGQPNLPKKLRFKKTRTKEISDDDSLEDTASSPVNSPKVSDLEQVEMNTRRAYDHHMNSSLGKKKKGGGKASPHHDSDDHEQRRDDGDDDDDDDEQSKMNFDDKNNLKRRGLCLVPMSMLVNYLG